jgi:hypothetical protein
MPAAPAKKHHTDVKATQEHIYAMPAYDVFGDGSKQLVVLWDSWNWGAGCTFSHPKFNRPVAWNGKVPVPTYDGRIDVYGLA